MVGSSSINKSPAFTSCPSRTWMDLTIPISNGWTMLVPPEGTIFPGAEATMSMWPNEAHPTTKQNMAMIVAATTRPAGEAGVSTISNAAGKNAVSSALSRLRALGNGAADLANFMDPRLQTIQVGITSGRPTQLVMRAILDNPPLLDSDNAIGSTYCRQAMSDDQCSAPRHDLSHIVLNDLFAFVVKCAGGFVKNENSRVHDQRSSDCYSLPLPTR